MIRGGEGAAYATRSTSVTVWGHDKSSSQVSGISEHKGNHDQRRDVAQRLKDGAGVSALSRAFKTSRQTIMRIRGGASTA